MIIRACDRSIMLSPASSLFFLCIVGHGFCLALDIFTLQPNLVISATDATANGTSTCYGLGLLLFLERQALEKGR